MIPLHLRDFSAWQPRSLGQAMSDSFYSSPAWRKAASAVTDGASCTRCGRRDHLMAHHVIPRAYGGSDVPKNLRPFCSQCHPKVEAATRNLLALTRGYGSRPTLLSQPNAAPATYGSGLLSPKPRLAPATYGSSLLAHPKPTPTPTPYGILSAPRPAPAIKNALLAYVSTPCSSRPMNVTAARHTATSWTVSDVLITRNPELAGGGNLSSEA